MSKEAVQQLKDLLAYMDDIYYADADHLVEKMCEHDIKLLWEATRAYEGRVNISAFIRAKVQSVMIMIDLINQHCAPSDDASPEEKQQMEVQMLRCLDNTWAYQRKNLERVLKNGRS